MGNNRHDWVWLKPDWQPGQTQADAIRHHHALGLPFVVASQGPSLGNDLCNLGLVTIPKIRHGFQVAITAIHQSQSPLLLSQTEPPQWRKSLAVLAQALPGLRVYGSLAWQHWTGQPHMNAQSDVDVLFYPESEDHLEQGLSILRHTPIPLDGEIIFPSGQAVSWREWDMGKPLILVKSNHKAALIERSSLLESLQP